MKVLFITLALLMVAAPAMAVDLSFAWDPVDTNVDGSPVDENFSGYYFYCSLTSGDYTDPLCKIPVGNVTTANIDVDLTYGQTGYFVVSAFNAYNAGTPEEEILESGFSNEVSYQYPFLCPAAPGALRLVQ